MIAQTS
jgi:phospholipase/lecithinase/hemolysin